MNKVSPATNTDLLQGPAMEPSGVDLPRLEWCRINRLRTEQGKCAYTLNKRKIVSSPASIRCECGEIDQVCLETIR